MLWHVWTLLWLFNTLFLILCSSLNLFIGLVVPIILCMCVMVVWLTNLRCWFASQEIGGVAWYRLCDLPSRKQDSHQVYQNTEGESHRFYMVSMLPSTCEAGEEYGPLLVNDVIALNTCKWPSTLMTEGFLTGEYNIVKPRTILDVIGGFFSWAGETWVKQCWDLRSGNIVLQSWWRNHSRGVCIDLYLYSPLLFCFKKGLPFETAELLSMLYPITPFLMTKKTGWPWDFSKRSHPKTRTWKSWPNKPIWVVALCNCIFNERPSDP